MLKKTLLAALLTTCSFSSMANWTGGLSYINLSDEADDIDLSLGVLAGSLGYKIEMADNFTVMPEFRTGFGVSEDTVKVYGVDIDVEVERFLSLSVRGQYDINNNVYVFAAPAYTNIDIEASHRRTSVSEDDWEFGFNAGLGYVVNDSLSFEVSYEEFDGADMFNFGVKFAI